MQKIKFIFIFSFAVFCFLGITRIAYAETYWVDDDGAASWTSCKGSNSISGTLACSWPTAVANVIGGDLVNLRGGTYVNPTLNTRSNTSGNDITFQAYTGENPVFDGMSTQWFVDGNHYIFDGISFVNVNTNAIGNRWLIISGNYNQFRNCSFSATGNQSYGFVDIEGGQHNTFYNDTFAGYTGFHIGIGYKPGYSVPGFYNVIDSCSFSNAGEYNIVLWNGSQYNEIKNSTIDCGANGAGLGNGLGISINDDSHSGITSYNLVENNLIKRWGSHVSQSKNGIQLYGSNNTIRRNRFYNGQLINMSYAIEGPRFGGGNLIYNNTFYYNQYFAMGVFGGNNSDNNKIVNNIFWYNKLFGPGPPTGYLMGPAIWADISDFSIGNRYYNNFIQYQNETGYYAVMLGGPTYYSIHNGTYPGIENNYPTQFYNNIEHTGGPGFLSETEGQAGFLQLAIGSPCIDAGVVVTDSTWGNLTYNGSAPDIGAIEYAFSDTTPPAAPTGVAVI